MAPAGQTWAGRRRRGQRGEAPIVGDGATVLADRDMAVAADAVGAVGGVVAGAEVQGDLPARVARRVVAAMGRPFEIGGRRCRVQVSVGLAVADGPGPVDAEDLLRRADAAMYAAKRKGKGRLVVAHSVGASAD